MADAGPSAQAQSALTQANTLGELVSSLLGILGINNTKFAQRAGTSRSNLNSITSGKSSPSQKIVRAIISTIAAENIDGLDEETIRARLGYPTKASISFSGFNSDEVGKYIAAVRGYLGLEQYEVAQEIGISQERFSSYEVGREIPPIETIAKFCRKMPIDVSNHKMLRDLVKHFYPDSPSSKPPSEQESFGKMIRAAREIGGKTREELAQLARVDVNYFKALEWDKIRASNAAATRLAYDLAEEFPEEFPPDSALEAHSFITKRALHPREWSEQDLRAWMLAARLYGGMSQVEISGILGRQSRTVRDYESGATSTPFEMIEKVYQACVGPHFDAEDPHYFSLQEVQDRFTSIRPQDQVRVLVGATGAMWMAENLPEALRSAQRRLPARAKDTVANRHLCEDLPDIVVLGLVRAVRQAESAGNQVISWRSTVEALIMRRIRDRQPIEATPIEDSIVAYVARTRDAIRASLGREPSDIELAHEIGTPANQLPGSVRGSTPANPLPPRSLRRNSGNMPPSGGRSPGR